MLPPTLRLAQVKLAHVRNTSHLPIGVCHVLQACFREQLWGSLLSLAGSFSSAREAPVAGASSALYVALFAGFDAPLERQQVLHALHGHLGSGVSGQQDVALQVRLEGGSQSLNPKPLASGLVRPVPRP